MRKLFILLCLAAVFEYAGAQTPQALNYQAVARTADGVIIPTQNISVRFSVLDGSVNGATLYSETHQTTTNSYGLFTLAIGRGTPGTGTFAGINWASGTDKFLKVEIAPSGGNNYQLQGTTQLLSVPFALYSEKTRLIAGNAINITNGNTISANYAGGRGINVTGNTISWTDSTYWKPHTYGIYYDNGHVGIGTTPQQFVPLTIKPVYISGNGNASLHLKSDDPWHTAMTMFNNVQQHYTFLVAGTTNTGAVPGTFGLFNHISLNWSFNFDPTTNNMAIGSTSFNANSPKSKLHVFNGDINIDQIGSGIIMKSPNGQCWRVTIDNAGNLVRTAITCPN